VTIADFTERELVMRIERRLPPAPPWLLVGIGDDAAVVEPERNRVEVLSVDALVEGIHFDRAFVPPDAIGHRALAVNLSDLAAMGAAPRLALLSLALPSALPIADFDAIVDGFAGLAGRHRTHVVGGNLTRSPGPLVIDVTIVGTSKRRQALTRDGARPGDELFVSGTIGAAAAGLRMLEMRARLATADAAQDAGNRAHRETGDASAASVSPGVERCIERYLRPQPRVRLGTLLARNRAASACIDLSDGLADGTHQIAQASRVGIQLDAQKLPIDPGARAWFEARGLDPVIESICAGDDYELLVAVGPRTRSRLAAVARHGDLPLTHIGVCTESRAVTIRREAVGGVTEEAVPSGYSHFRAAEGSSLDEARSASEHVEGPRSR
jgi:thiamine-monophosphate kinase